MWSVYLTLIGGLLLFFYLDLKMAFLFNRVSAVFSGACASQTFFKYREREAERRDQHKRLSQL